MSFRSWLFITAVGLALASPTLAQTPDDQGVTQGSPTPESQTATSTEDDNTSAEGFSLPVRIIESPDESKRSGEIERQTQEHDAADLEAQQRAAKAAEDSARAAEWQKWPTVWQVRLGFVAAFGLIVSLILNVVATKAAFKAIGVAEDIGKRELRAYMNYGIPVVIGAGDEADLSVRVGVYFFPAFKNFGVTPANKAMVTSVRHVIEPTESVPPVQKPTEPPPDGFKGAQVGPQSHHSGYRILFTLDELRRFSAAGKRMIISARIDYEDVFGEPHYTEACIEVDVVGDLKLLEKDAFSPAQIFAFPFFGPHNSGN